MRRAGATLRLAVCATVLAFAPALVRAETAPVVLDQVVVRFISPETGGSANPRFVAGRTLAFEARLEAMVERSEGLGEDYDERSVRAALDRHIAEEMLASSASKLIAGMSAVRRPDAAALERVREGLAAALFERFGGPARVEAAAAAEQLDRFEIDELLRRQALAAWYIDRAVAPILRPTDEQLRQVFRTAAHPYRGQSFEQARPLLERWFVAERLRVAAGSFLQAARARVRVVIVR